MAEQSFRRRGGESRQRIHKADRIYKVAFLIMETANSVSASK